MSGSSMLQQELKQKEFDPFNRQRDQNKLENKKQKNQTRWRINI